jgi:hypothetical protein
VIDCAKWHNSSAKFTWQDSLNIASLLFTIGIARAEDMIFLSIYSVLACLCAVKGIWSHQELSRNKQISACSVLFVVVISLGVSQFRSIRARELSASYGSLIPAGAPSPLSNCSIPPGAVAIYAGSSAVWSTGFPFAPISIGGYVPLTIDKNSKGELLVNATIFDDRENLIAKIENSQYIATNYSSHFKRADRSSFIVFDHSDKVALQVRFVNDVAVQVSGIFHSPKGGRTVVVTDDNIRSGKVDISGYCTGNAATGFAF